jgi:DNA-binding transcriptional ArsR family regulator
MSKINKIPRRRRVSCSERLKVVADPTRLAVLRILMTEGPHTVSDINLHIKVEQSLLSHHLQILRAAGMVKNVRCGKSIRYELSPAASKASDSSIDLGCCAISFRD